MHDCGAYAYLISLHLLDNFKAGNFQHPKHSVEFVASFIQLRRRLFLSFSDTQFSSSIRNTLLCPVVIPHNIDASCESQCLKL